MGFADAFAAGILKYGYSADWLEAHQRVIRAYREGATRQGVAEQSKALRDRKPFKEPENFLQAYYNAHYWSNLAKDEGNKRLYRKKDEAIIRALGHLNYEGIEPIRPKGHPGLLEIQVPSHGVLLHTYNPRIKRMIIEEGHRIPIKTSPADPYLQGRKVEIAKQRMREKARGRLTGSAAEGSILPKRSSNGRTGRPRRRSRR